MLSIQKEFEREAPDHSLTPDDYIDWLEKKLFEARTSDEQLQRLYEWLTDPNRKPAQTAFTAGWLRNVAREIEFQCQ